MKKILIILFCLISISLNAQTTYYGTNYGSDGLQNLRVGSATNSELSYRFKAEQTGTVEGVIVFYRYTIPDYGLGDGGEIRIDLETDNPTTHRPSGTVIATLLDANPMGHLPLDNNYYHIALTFDDPVAVTEGTIYHLHFSNEAADSDDNWICLNTLFVWSGINADIQPTIDTLDLAVLTKTTGNWAIYGTTPIYSLIYSDDSKTGQGYPYTSFSHSITGASYKVRSNITVSGGNKTINKVWARLIKVSGTEPLNIRLEESDGTLIEETNIAASGISATYATWVSYEFTTNHLLENGETYHLVLSTGSSTTYSVPSLEDGGEPGTYSWGYKRMFADGHYEYTEDGKTWSDIVNGSGYIPTTAYKLQSYFSLIAPMPGGGQYLIYYNGKPVYSNNKIVYR